MAEQYYCPVSARIDRGGRPLITPVDAGPRKLDADPDLQSVAAGTGLVPGPELSPASDACLAAFEDGTGCLLISRDSYSPEELVAITDDLLQASAAPRLSGVLDSRVSDEGHVIVRVDYRPKESLAELTGEDVVELFSELRRAHAGGIVHGGINERFINPDAEEGRRITGFGLASLYAAWRRKQGLNIGDVTADPRFASAQALRGAAPDDSSDRFSLAAVALTLTSSLSPASPATIAVNGINGHLERAAAVQRHIDAADTVEDSKLRAQLLSALSRPDKRRLPIWLLPLAIVGGLILLLQMLTLARDPKVETAAGTTSTDSVECVGTGVQLIAGQCRALPNSGVCGENTSLDSATGRCIAASVPSTPTPAPGPTTIEEPEVPDVATPAGEWIHPVVDCQEGQSRTFMSYEFSNDDMNLSNGEKAMIARRALSCAGVANVIYYTSKPGLESRTNTVFREFRSSSQCGERCQEIMPARPTAVVYVPYVDTIDRGTRHYMFFECCDE